MSINDVIDRGISRALQIWPRFLFQMPQDDLPCHEIIIGMYSLSYQQGINYLQDITADDLMMLAKQYDMSMAELTAGEARFMQELAAKQYLAELDLFILDAAIDTKWRKLDATKQEYAAKERAIEADRKAIETKQAEFAALRDKIATRIKQLETEIFEEEVTSAKTDYEIGQQELVTRKAQLDVAEAGIKVLAIQADITQLAYEIAKIAVDKADMQADTARINMDVSETEARKTETEADIAQIQARTETEKLTESQREVAQAELTAYKAETVMNADYKHQLYAAKGENLVVENLAVDTLKTATQIDAEADRVMQGGRINMQIDENNLQAEMYKQKAAISNRKRDFDEYFYRLKAANTLEESNKKIGLMDMKLTANNERNQGALEATEIAMAANIVNTVTHTIGKSS